MKLPDLVKHLSSNADSYPNILSAMSRILAAKPHSADVERCISANNLLKTSLRSSIKLTTENRYLFIHHNLPPTAVWDPRPTVLNWLKRTHREKGQTKAKSQSYFKHVFAEAQENCEDIEEALMHLKNRQGADSFDIFRLLALLNTMNRRPKCN